MKSIKNVFIILFSLALGLLGGGYLGILALIVVNYITSNLSPIPNQEIYSVSDFDKSFQVIFMYVLTGVLVGTLISILFLYRWNKKFKK